MSLERLAELTRGALAKKDLDTDEYRRRLEKELVQAEIQGEEDYFLHLHDTGIKFPFNEQNLLVPYLLDIVSDFDIDRESAFTQEDLPDIDCDTIPLLRDYIKNVWAPKTFGADKVCAIANYTTFGIKSSLIDMARVHSKNRDEILSLTTKLGLKDDDGNKLTWEKALEMYPALRKYCEANPDVAESSRQLLERNRSLGQHAGGLIISRIPISDLVPLVRGKDGQPCSSWTEGLANSDLGPVGLIKFDFLVITDLLRILVCSRMIKQRHGLTSICALPGLSDWSDEAYLNDKAALKLADTGRLKGIFQFDSGGIRHLVKAGGVDSFEDLVAYVSLYRPGPMAMGMHDRYVERKRGREEWESKLHPLLKPIMGKTYGVLVYQEQILKILNQIGGIPEMQTEKIRKAISKKKLEQFTKYKDMFFKNAGERLGWPVSREGENQEFTVQWLYDQIEAFSGYGFNRSHAVAYTFLTMRLLYFKVHYPLEFFTATLQCEHVDDKLREYMLDARRHDIAVQPLNLNKSKENFTIVDGDIYSGFAKVKGIGQDIAKKIVSEPYTELTDITDKFEKFLNPAEPETGTDKRQPYSSLEDFCYRFGTHSNVLKPLIALRVFGNNARELYKYYDHYKEDIKRRKNRDTRNTEARAKYVSDTAQILNVLPDVAAKFLEDFRIADYGKRKEFFAKYHDEATQEDVWQIGKKYQKCVDSYNDKVDFDARVKVERIDEVEIDPELAAIFENRERAEMEYYGFTWKHPLQAAVDYDPELCFAQFDENQFLLAAPVQVVVVSEPRKKLSKNGNTTYWTFLIEDCRYRRERINVWNDEWNRFEPEFSKWDATTKRGGFLQLKLKRPTNGFHTYNLDSPSRREKWKTPKTKEEDYRVLVLLEKEVKK